MFKPAVKEKLKARIAIEGPSGSGKTYSALLLARGLVGDIGKIAMIDTEQESGKLYANLIQFDHATLEAPYTPERYISLLQMAEGAGYDCIVIDSMSHEWIGTGGILEIHDSLPGNSYTNWAKVNPRHNKFLETILKSKCHIIATMRSKQAYALETNEKGKQEPKKLGLAPQQRDGMEYEFTAVLKVDISHMATGDKDRTGLFPSGEWFKPTEAIGAELGKWLNEGTDCVKPTAKQEESPQKTEQDPPSKYTSKEQKYLDGILDWIDKFTNAASVDLFLAQWDLHGEKALAAMPEEHKKKAMGAKREMEQHLMEKQEKKA